MNERGDFRRIHPMPATSGDVPDDLDARLVVLGVDHPYTKESGNAAEAAAKDILENRGNSPRIYRNTLVFLAADKTRLQDLDEAVRSFLAWESILKEKNELNLDPHQVTQAENQKVSANTTVDARLPETFQWLLVPTEVTPQDAVSIEALRLSGNDKLAIRAAKKLKSGEQLLTSFGGTRLRMELDRVLWRDQDSVAIRQLVDDFARYLYLPRLASSSVLLEAINSGLRSLSWQVETFSYAEGYDENTKRFRGLRKDLASVFVTDPDSTDLLVMPEVAIKQIEAEEALIGISTSTPSGATATGASTSPFGRQHDEAAATRIEPRPNRFHGTVTLDPTRVGRDASQIAEEVLSHLTALVGANVEVTLEISASIPDGVPENVVRTVTENSRTLKFSSQGFESE